MVSHLQGRHRRNAETGYVGVKGYLSTSATNAPTIISYDDLVAGPA